MANIASLFVDGNRAMLKCNYEQKDYIKKIKGRQWNPEAKAWEFPIKPEVVKELRYTIPKLKVDDSLLGLLEETEESIIDWNNQEPVEPLPIKEKPFLHQIAAFNLGLKIPQIALLMEQGCGKSLTAVAIAGRRYLRGEIRRLLVVAPSSVCPVWPREFKGYASFPYEVKLLEGPVKKRVKALVEWEESSSLKVAVINYEAVWRMEEELGAWGPDMIICDESQKIKSPESHQSKALHNLAHRAPYRMILSGTPITQGPLDIFSQYKFLQNEIFGENYYAFEKRYCVKGGYNNHEDIVYQNIPELVEKAHSIAIRVSKKQALDLPECINQVLYCELDPTAKKVYDQLLQESIAELAGYETITAVNALARLTRLSQITGGFMKEEEKVYQVSKAKLKLLEEVLENILRNGKKVIIFTRFLPELDAIKGLLESQGIDYALICGDVKTSKRGEEVERFQSDSNCRVFLVQTQAGGMGITLTAASVAIFYSMSFSLADYEQAKARIHRIGQKDTVLYIHLLARNTVDEDIFDALKSKKSIAQEITDNWGSYFKNRKRLVSAGKE